MGPGVEGVRCLRRLVVVADVFVIGDVIGDDDFRLSVFRAPLEHVNLVVVEDNLGINASEALRAKTQRKIIVGILSRRHVRG